MKPIKFSPEVKKQLKVIRLKNTRLYSKVQKQLYLFINNPRHKSLRLHKIKRSDKIQVWSISIDMSFRMLYTESQEDYYFFEIGTHDEVYRK